MCLFPYLFTYGNCDGNREQGSGKPVETHMQVQPLQSLIYGCAHVKQYILINENNS